MFKVIQWFNHNSLSLSRLISSKYQHRMVFNSHPQNGARDSVFPWVPTVGFLEDEHFSLKSIHFVARQGQSALIGVEAKRLSIGMGFHWCFREEDVEMMIYLQETYFRFEIYIYIQLSNLYMIIYVHITYIWYVLVYIIYICIYTCRWIPSQPSLVHPESFLGGTIKSSYSKDQKKWPQLSNGW